MHFHCIVLSVDVDSTRWSVILTDNKSLDKQIYWCVSTDAFDRSNARYTFSIHYMIYSYILHFCNNFYATSWHHSLLLKTTNKRQWEITFKRKSTVQKPFYICIPLNLYLRKNVFADGASVNVFFSEVRSQGIDTYLIIPSERNRQLHWMKLANKADLRIRGFHQKPFVMLLI